MHRKSISRRGAAAASATLNLDDSFPTPLTSRNLPPRSEARTAASSSSSRRPARPPVLLMPPKPTASSSSSASSSSRTKRARSQTRNLPRKRARKAAKREVSSEGEEEQLREEGEEEDQLVDDDSFVETILLPSEIEEANRARRLVEDEEELEAATTGSGAGPSRLRDSPSPPLAGSSVRDGDTPPVASGSGSGSSKRLASAPPREEPEPLSSYSCPICFFPPTNATLTPCGHICCGSCLFTAVKTMTQRGAMMPEASVARCPVCRAPIPGWDGRGGGVVGLKIRAMFSL
ncbi:hypothetical protein FB45DRAFT_360231 [Roridomyces roridus]|uniref:RING-type domain-containing protein n=1 Tax=Roridomyces roridus TaxID=1738132 RepID=A0AAD7FT21_9AGAR|nr:hypothetical protein FB45DRAFT_360231 [Roridomyces roridus]